MPTFEIDINFNINSDGLTEAEQELQNIQDTADSTTDSADNLDASLENVDGSSLQGASSSADDLKESLDGASSSADNLENSMSVIEGSMLLSVGTQLGGMSSSLEGVAQQMDTASISVGQLATNVGMAEPQMVDLINNISNVTFPNNEAMAYVNQLNQMGVSADKLGESAINMDRLNDATGMGYANVMQLTQGLQAVGISADNLPASFNAVAFAEANVNGGAETMGRVFKRQASTINEYGLTADQVVLIMQKLSEQGVSNMKMGTELSAVLKDNNGDLQAIEQSLGMQSGALENATATTSQYEGQIMSLANEEMQHKTLTQQLGAVWEDISLKMSGVLSPMASVGGMISQLGNVGMTIRGLREIGQSMRDVTTAINIMRNAESLSAGVKAIFTTALGIETTATEADAVAKEVGAGSNTLFATSEWAILAPVLLVVGAIALLIGVLWYLYNNNETARQSVDWLAQQFQLFIGRLLQVGQTIASFVSNSISAFLRWVTGGGQASTNLVNAIYNALVTLPSRVQSAVSGITGILTKPFTDAWNTISPLINRIGDGLNQLNPTSWFGAEYEGVQYEGFNGNTLNGVISSSTSNSSSVTNNFNINGIIEEEASQYIVNSVNDYVKKQNLIRGV